MARLAWIAFDFAQAWLSLRKGRLLGMTIKLARVESALELCLESGENGYGSLKFTVI
jgi:hypothetical protein